jgi:hypothetical protein
MTDHLDARFTAAQTDWDLDRLYQDLAKAKGKPLSPIEKLHSRGLLCGLSPIEIAKVLRKKPKGVHVDLAKTLYPYMAIIAGKTDEGIGNWRNFRLLAEKLGYKKTLPSSQPSSQVGQSSNTGSQPFLNTGTIVNIHSANVIEIHAQTIHIGESEYVDINFRVGPFPSTKPPKKDKEN